MPRISLTQPSFTHGEACEISGVRSADLYNWIHRGIIDPGAKRRSGRRLYSIIDLINLRVLGDLTHVIGMRPAFASAILDNVLPRAAEVAALDENGRLVGRSKSPPQFLLAWVEPENDVFTVGRADGGRLTEAVSVPHPVIVVPIDEISVEITMRALLVLNSEA